MSALGSAFRRATGCYTSFEQLAIDFQLEPGIRLAHAGRAIPDI